MRALADRPAVIAWTIDPVDRLPIGLANAAYEQIAVSGPVEADPERIADAPGVDLGPAEIGAAERVCSRNGVAGRAAVDIDPQDLAVEEAEVLGIAVVFAEPLGIVNGSSGSTRWPAALAVGGGAT